MAVKYTVFDCNRIAIGHLEGERKGVYLKINRETQAVLPRTLE
jgi:hypothetical protein